MPCHGHLPPGGLTQVTVQETVFLDRRPANANGPVRAFVLRESACACAENPNPDAAAVLPGNGRFVAKGKLLAPRDFVSTDVCRHSDGRRHLWYWNLLSGADVHAVSDDNTPVCG